VVDANEGSVHPSIKDVVIYIVLFVVIVWGFTYIPTGWLEVLTAGSCSWVLRAFGLSSSWGSDSGNVWLQLLGEQGPITVTIIRECTAINVFAVVTGLTAPLRADIRRKGSAIAFSGVVLYLMNLSRITLTVFLTGFSFPPFSWFFTNPTVELYHFPISFLYGVLGVALLVLMISGWFLPELADVLLDVVDVMREGVLGRCR